MNTKYTSTQIVAITRDPHNTVEHGQLITKKYLGEHKVITAEQQFLGLILWFFYVFKMAVAFASLRGFAVEPV